MCGGASLVVVGGVMVAGAVCCGGLSFAEGTGLRAVRALRRKRKIQEAAQVEKTPGTAAQEVKATAKAPDAAARAAAPPPPADVEEALAVESPLAVVQNEKIPSGASVEAEAEAITAPLLVAA